LQVFREGGTDTFEGEASLTEEGVQVVFCLRRLVVGIDVGTVGSNELPPKHYVNTEISVCLTDTQYDIFDV